MTLTSTTIKKLRALNLTDDVFDKVLEIMEESKVKAPKKGDAADRAARGSRLAKDWALPRRWGQYALQQGLSEYEVRREAEQFRNYWVARPGAGGIKLDWEGTWGNWIIRAATKLGRTPLPDPDAPQAAAGPATFTIETWSAIMRRYQSSGQWKHDHGPKPGDRGCLVPVELLTPVGQMLFDSSSEPCHK